MSNLTLQQVAAEAALEKHARAAGMDVMTGWRDDDSTCTYFEAWPEQLLELRNRILNDAAKAAAAHSKEAAKAIRALKIKKITVPTAA